MRVCDAGIPGRLFPLPVAQIVKKERERPTPPLEECLELVRHRGKIVRRSVVHRHPKRDGETEPDSTISRVGDRAPEFIQNVLWVRIAPACAMLTIVLRTVDVQVEVALAQESEHAVAFGEVVVRSVKPLDGPADWKWRAHHEAREARLAGR